MSFWICLLSECLSSQPTNNFLNLSRIQNVDLSDITNYFVIFLAYTRISWCGFGIVWNVIPFGYVYRVNALCFMPIRLLFLFSCLPSHLWVIHWILWTQLDKIFTVIVTKDYGNWYSSKRHIGEKVSCLINTALLNDIDENVAFKN